ncbi:MAG TPA: glutathione S-transferase C-terminal domain-containing protein, partial [Polyangiales bacterium]
AHDTHHPIGGGLYYEDQKPESQRRSRQFIAERVPKFLNYFEDVLAQNGHDSWLVGKRCSYADLSLFQVVAGLRYAFPRALERIVRKVPHVMSLSVRVAARPRLAAYLMSPRRIPFNEDGIFRHYPELDEQPTRPRTAKKKKR